MSKHWRLLLDLPADGATNMARDEALALSVATSGQPTLRLYCWSPQCVSLGRFQSVAEVDAAACRQRGVDLVRRPSGGRAVFHGAELTYSVVAPADHQLLAGGVRQTYCTISHALLAGLRLMGVEAEMQQAADDRGRAAAADRDSTAGVEKIVFAARRPSSCFDLASDYEVMVAGRKLVGSAQVRMAGALLQHGSLPLTVNTEQLRPLLTAPSPMLGQHMIALDAAAGRAVGWDEAASALGRGFAESWGIELVAGVLSADEQVLAAALRVEKYASEAWTNGRGKR